MNVLQIFFQARRRSSAWWWGLQLGIAAALLVRWWLEKQQTPVQVKPARPAAAPSTFPEEEPSKPPSQPVARAEPDDLTRIRGIGPKYAALLNAAGVTRFAQLAAMSEAELKTIFAPTGRVPDVSDWAAQAERLMEG